MKWFVLLLIGMAGCMPYSKADKIAFGVYCASVAADVMSTRDVLQAGGREMNPLLDEQPSDRELIGLKLGGTAVLWLIGEIWPEYREEIWYSSAIVQGGAAIWNSSQ